MSQLNTQQLRDYPKHVTQVYLYGTCLVDTLFPQSGIDAIELLERQGIEVIYPQKQSCCGQPAYNSGYTDQAKDVAREQAALFPLDIPIVVISGSCGGMMRHHYQTLLKDDPTMATFGDRIFEFSEFLVNVLNISLDDKGDPERVALHTSCAARREMGSHITSQKLLKQLSNVEVIVHDKQSECCGFGGTFSLKHGDISIAMVTDKTQHLIDSGASTYVSADWGCMMNINCALEYQQQPMRGEHIASYLLSRLTTGEQS